MKTAQQMRAENEVAFANLTDTLRQANLLMEFPPKDWAAYNAKHFGLEITIGNPPADPKDVAWKDPHKSTDISEPEPSL